MRHPRGRASQASLDGGQDYLASVSDLMAGLIFFFIITLAVFAQQMAQQKEKLTQDLQGSRGRRNDLIRDIHAKLQEQGLTVAIDTTQGVIRFQDAIRFRLGVADLDEAPRANVDKLAHVLHAILPDYVHDTDVHALDAVFVEGHTDSIPISGQFRDNLELSSARARSVYLALMESEPQLRELVNADSQYVFSASGYGERRPLTPESNRTIAGQEANRRIDLRFIMASRPPAPAEAVSEAFRR